MTVKTEILNTREVKKFNELVKSQWGTNFGNEFVFLKSSKDRIYVINRDIEKVPLEKLNIASIGLYIATWSDRGLRLSLDGTHILGKVKKNTVEINQDQVKAWMGGEDLDLSDEQVKNNEGYLIVTHKEDVLGCGRLSENKLFNMISKSRKVSL